jgi:cobalt-zinc-cadmium efflux system outer membrane protein
VTVDRYRENMIPRAKRSYELMLQRWGQMGASYPQVLLAQRTLFSLQTGYINALEQLWINSLALEGFLLTDGLEAPRDNP